MTDQQLSPFDIELLEKATSNLRDRLLVRLLSRLHLRITEALNLEVKDIDFTQRTARVNGKRRARRRTVPIDGVTLAITKQYVEQGGPVMKDGKLLVFGINRHRAWGIIQELAEKAHLPKLLNGPTGKVHAISPDRLRDAYPYGPKYRKVAVTTMDEGKRYLVTVQVTPIENPMNPRNSFPRALLPYGPGPYEALVLEVSPSKEMVKLSFFGGMTKGTWFKQEDIGVIEQLTDLPPPGPPKKRRPLSKM